MESGQATGLPRRRGGTRLVMLLAIVLSALSCHEDAPEPLSPFTETIPPAQAGLAEADRATLVEFYRATGGDRWQRRDGWLSDDPIGTWHGVRVEGSRVVRLDLTDNNLRGHLPKVVAELAGLRVLRLDRNRLWAGFRQSGRNSHSCGSLDCYRTFFPAHSSRTEAAVATANP